MKKPLLALVGIMIVVAAFAAISAQRNHKTAAPAPIHYSVKKSCDILTKQVVAEIYGTDIAKKNTLETKSSIANLSYNSCSYGGAQGSATLLLHSAINKAAANANAKQFGAGKPAGTKAVAGYGDAAYWDPTTGQLNILKHGAWYGVSAGPSANAKSYTLEQSKKLADLLADKL